VLLPDRKILRGEVRSYLTSEEFRSALKLWRRWRRYGLPHGGLGWAWEPSATMEILDLFEDEALLYELEKQRPEKGKKEERR